MFNKILIFYAQIFFFLVNSAFSQEVSESKPSMVSAQLEVKDIKRVAVLELKDNSKGMVTVEERIFLSNLIRQASNRLPQDRFMVMTQENILALLPPKTKLEDCVNECTITTGRMLGADYIVTGEVVKFGGSLRIALKLHESASGALKSSDTLSGNKVEELEGNIQGSAIGLFSELDPSLKRSAERLKKGFIYEKFSLVDTSVLDVNNQKGLSKLESQSIEIPSFQQSEVKGIDFGSVNIDALEAYQNAVDMEKNQTISHESKVLAWEKLEKIDSNSDLGRLAKERINIWNQKIQNDYYQKVINFDQGTSSTQEKISVWQNLANLYPNYQSIADQRINEWKTWQMNEDQKLNEYTKLYEQMIDVERKRSQKRDEDWQKLSKLLKLTVISEDDKNSWLEAFIEAYGVHELLNPHYTQINATYVNAIKDRYDSILAENRAELKNRLTVLLKAPKGFWENHDLFLWNHVILGDASDADIERIPVSLQSKAKEAIKKALAEKQEIEMQLKMKEHQKLVLENMKREKEKKEKKEKEEQIFLAEEKKRAEKSRYVLQMLESKHNFKLVPIAGGEFMMGNDYFSIFEQPAHIVNIRNFYISKTEVTVEQYKKCVEVGVCSEPRQGNNCNWNKWFVDNEPVNCVTWHQARTFARWLGGDLPSEAQWEYAARSRGQNIKYPWGNSEPTCEFAVYKECENHLMNVCSKLKGNTEQGLCDMAGNLWEWVLDEWHESYKDGSNDYIPWCIDRTCSTRHAPNRVSRGGGFGSKAAYLRTTDRDDDPANDSYSYLGFRVAMTY